jgi:hypothetical protein
MSRRPSALKKPATKQRRLPPKHAPRPVLKPLARTLPKQHRGGR